MFNKGYLEAVRWWNERADPDFDDGSVDILFESQTAELRGYAGTVGDDETDLVRFSALTEEDGEEVEYTVDVSENLLRAAVEELDKVN